MPKTKGLTAKQAKFVQEYLSDLNATQAAIRAGYSAASAAKIGSELLQKTRVAEAVAAAQAKLQKKLDITQERVLREMGRIAFVDVRKLFDENGALKKPHELDEDTAAAVASLDLDEGKVKLFAKPDTLRDLGKHLGIFGKDNQQKNEAITSFVEKVSGRSRGLPAQHQRRDR